MDVAASAQNTRYHEIAASAAPSSGATESPPLIADRRMADIITWRFLGTRSNSSAAEAVAEDRDRAPDSAAAT